MAASFSDLVLTSEANDCAHHDLYHSLADELHEGVGRILDEVLGRHHLGRKTRQEIVGYFLFKFMRALDSQAMLTRSERYFESYPNLDLTEPDARKTWQPALAFLRRDAGENDLPGEVKTALIATDTWLHEVCGDWQDGYFGKKDKDVCQNPD